MWWARVTIYVWRKSLQGGAVELKGAFHLSELTGQPIPIVMRIPLLIKTNHPGQSNPKYYAQRRWFSAKPLEKSLFHCQNVWFGHRSDRPVLTFGKRRKFVSMYEFINCLRSLQQGWFVSGCFCEFFLLRCVNGVTSCLVMMSCQYF